MCPYYHKVCSLEVKLALNNRRSRLWFDRFISPPNRFKSKIPVIEELIIFLGFEKL